MFAKTFPEMLAVDVSQYVKTRDDKKDTPEYLPWADCKALLHENGADVVEFYPVPGEDGTSLHRGSQEFTNKNGDVNRIYEVVVHIKVDDMEWDETYPVMDGNIPVTDRTMNQLRVHNAIARAFVKGVAKRTGLGFSLWMDHDDLPADPVEDLSKHSLRKCKQRLEELITGKIQQGIPFNIIADRLHMSEDELRAVGAEYGRLMRIEKTIYDMVPER